MAVGPAFEGMDFIIKNPRHYSHWGRYAQTLPVPASVPIRGETRCAYIWESSINWPVFMLTVYSSLR